MLSLVKFTRRGGEATGFPKIARHSPLRASSNRTTYAAVGLTRADDAAKSIPDGACCGTHRVPRQSGIRFSLLVRICNRVFNLIERLPGVFHE
jgi:hypothetical protein